MVRWIFLALFALMTLSACSSADELNAKIELSPSKITVEDGQLSQEVRVFVSKEDSTGVSASFTIELVTPNPEMFTYVTSNTTISSIQTGVLRHEGDRLSDVFTVRANKPQGSENTQWIGTLRLLHEGSLIDEENIHVTVE